MTHAIETNALVKTFGKTRALDGVDLLPLLAGEKSSLPERTLCFQWHRGDVPEMYRACAARRGRSVPSRHAKRRARRTELTSGA